jgi:hypothetical protein
MKFFRMQFVERTACQPCTGKKDPQISRGSLCLLSPLSKGMGGFQEVELGFDEEQAKREAKRCLQCDLEIRLAQEWMERKTKQVDEAH